MTFVWTVLNEMHVSAAARYAQARKRRTLRGRFAGARRLLKLTTAGRSTVCAALRPASRHDGSSEAVVNIDSLNVLPMGAEAAANTGRTPPWVKELEM
jgi:hypothetical protein